MSTDYSTITATSSTLDVIIWFFVIILFIVILFLLYYFLNKSIKKGPKNKEVALVKKYYIDRNLYIGLLRVFNEYYLVLISSNSSEVLRKVDEDEVFEIIGESPKFINTFTKFLKRDKTDEESKKE
jgi:flagellar protein FliO/FliZ